MPDVARWERVKELFQRALDRPDEEREAFLSEACSFDTDLKREVESLLTAQRDAAGFLSRPMVSDSEALEALDVQGRRVGPYRILGRIGHGGMGVVYRAVRDDDVFHKAVALKLVHGGARPEHLIRLGKERQILARLQHPNIATILDGGATEDGDPYLVMEYVEGESIDNHCNGRGLATRDRLQMFRTVCTAVHYAHQNLVVHRDLKPQNILVTADGLPKLLDFGIAKLLAAGVDPEAAPTATMLPMMTPEYASPEQVRGEPVTTASDVYSLGVVLYELLTGRPPLVIRADSMAEIVRSVCETEPPLASAAAGIGGRGGSKWGAQASELKGDLDTILLKALRKDPARRYLSAQELAEDIGRHLEGRPVLARKDTLRYRVGKFAGRHRTVVAAATLLLVTLVGGLAATAWQWRRAEANRVREQRRFADVRKLANSFLFEFHDAIKDLPGSTEARKLVVSKALEYLDSLQQEQGADLGLKLELAKAYKSVGEIQGYPYVANLGDTRGALASFRKAQAIAEELARSEPDNRDYEEHRARTSLQIANLYSVAGDLRSALESSRHALAIVEKLATRYPKDASIRNDLVACYETVGDELANSGKLEDGLQLFYKSAEVIQSLLRESPDDEQTLLAWIGNRNSVALVLGNPGYVNLGDPVRALVAIQEAVAACAKKSNDETADEQYKTWLAQSLRSRGEIQSALGDWSGAESSYREALAVWAPLVKADPKEIYRQLYRAYALANLGEALAERGKTEEALELLAEAIVVTKRLSESDPDNWSNRTYVAYSYSLQGGVLAKRGETARAVPSFRRAIDTYQAILKDDVANLQIRWELAPPCLGLGRTYLSLSRAAPNGRSSRYCHEARTYLQCARDNYVELQRHFKLPTRQEAELNEADSGLAWCDRTS